ncbi:MAG: hypothetical protein NTV63_04115 [Candidatus Woesearchaeota archaeon]|nr:hypothetical protein [Candidatus Woesearchaeota archaeon]
MPKHTFEAIATLVGCTIGAGILGIPYVVSRAGFLTGLFVIIIIGIVMLTLNLCAGEIVLRTNGDHQLAGYVNKYLGKGAKKIMGISMVLSIYGAMLAYLIKEGEFLTFLFGGVPFVNSLLFFGVISFLIYSGLKMIERSEKIIVTIVIAMIAVIFFLAVPKISANNLSGFDAKRLLVPYGVVLFAFMGTTCIPELREELRANRKEFRKAVVIGTLIPLAVYSVFALSVVGAAGIWTSEGAVESIMEYVGKSAGVFAASFAVLSMTTASLALGLALKNMYIYDYHKNRLWAWFLTCFVPLGLFLFVKNFIKVLSVTGAFTGGITGILLILSYVKAKTHGDHEPEYSVNLPNWGCAILILIFAIGIIYETLSELGIIRI